MLSKRCRSLTGWSKLWVPLTKVVLVSYIHITDLNTNTVWSNNGVNGCMTRMKMTYRWRGIIFIGSLLGCATWLIRVHFNRLRSATLFLFRKFWVQHKRRGNDFSHWRFVISFLGTPAPTNTPKLTTDAGFCTHIVLMHTHTHTT